jgi:pyridinium-3,5-bisthiocarboxylic acid mononucleotide nickel chelatase
MIVWLNPFSGISGDMLLGALLDLGAPLDGVRDAIASTGLTGWSLDTREVRRGGMRALHAEVTVDDDAPERGAAELLDLVGRATPEPVALLARAAVSMIAEVESRVHQVPVADVQLHEIGGLDTVVDTVGVAAALHLLGVTEVWSGPLALGSGVVSTRHGLLPVPTPATAELLRGMPVTSVDTAGETVTPTGVALLGAVGCRFGPLPVMTVRGTGYGAGSRDPSARPNVLPATLGAPATDAGGYEPMVCLQTTVDDVTGEVLGYLTSALLDAGAADVWTVPGTGKKNRPVHVLTVLSQPGRAEDLRRLLMAETGSLGVRRSQVDRFAAPRRTIEILVAGRTVRIKCGPHRMKPEYDDLVAVARATGLTLRTVAERALAAVPPS